MKAGAFTGSGKKEGLYENFKKRKIANRVTFIARTFDIWNFYFISDRKIVHYELF